MSGINYSSLNALNVWLYTVTTGLWDLTTTHLLAI